MDDEEFCQTVMKGLLFKHGVDIENGLDLCITGQEALEKVASVYDEGCTYKMIFMDFSMPVMDGIESTRRIR